MVKQFGQCCEIELGRRELGQTSSRCMSMDMTVAKKVKIKNQSATSTIVAKVQNSCSRARVISRRAKRGRREWESGLTLTGATFSPATAPKRVRSKMSVMVVKVMVGPAEARPRLSLSDIGRSMGVETTARVCSEEATVS